MSEYDETEYLSEDISQEELIGRDKQEYPKIVTDLFVKKKKTFKEKLNPFKWGKSQTMMNPNLKQPLLFLMKNDGFTDVIEGCKVGSVFVVKDKENGREKGILLSQKKLSTLNFEPYYKCWHGSEDEMSPYPTDIVFDSRELVDIIRRVESNKGLLKDQAKLINAKMMFWLAIIGGIAIFLYFAFQAGWIQALLRA